MLKFVTIALAVLFASHCLADTFVHRQTGETFNGYVMNRKKGNQTQVGIEKRSPRYLNLGSYDIQRNYLGRKNRIYTFSIKNPIELISETEAFEKAIASAANHGPLFILIEIDTPGGRIELAQRMCMAIAKVDNCDTVAFVNGEKVGGAFSEGAVVALSCDKVYMRSGTAIGAAPYLRTSLSNQEKPKQTPDTESISGWSVYCASVAEDNNRPMLLVKAMVDKTVEVIEVREDRERLFIHPDNKKETQTTVRTWSDAKSLLTLTAGEAARTGIADHRVGSLAELFIDLEATKAKQIPDRTMLKARRVFKRVQAKFDDIIAVIEDIDDLASRLAVDFNSVDQEFRSKNRIGMYGSYGNIFDELERLRINRILLLNDLLAVLDDLIRNYQRALPLADKNPDLQPDFEALQNRLESAQNQHRNMLLQLRAY